MFCSPHARWGLLLLVQCSAVALPLLVATLLPVRQVWE